MQAMGILTSVTAAGQTLDKIDANVESITGEPTRKNTAESVGNNVGDDELISGYPMPFPMALKRCNERIDELVELQKLAENVPVDLSSVQTKIQEQAVSIDIIQGKVEEQQTALKEQIDALKQETSGMKH